MDQYLVVGGPHDGQVANFPRGAAPALSKLSDGFYLREHLTAGAVVYRWHQYGPSRWAPKPTNRVDFTPRKARK